MHMGLNVFSPLEYLYYWENGITNIIMMVVKKPTYALWNVYIYTFLKESMLENFFYEKKIISLWLKRENYRTRV